MSSLQYKEFIASLTTAELLDLIIEVSRQTADTLEMIEEEIKTRLMQQAE